MFFRFSLCFFIILLTSCSTFRHTPQLLDNGQREVASEKNSCSELILQFIRKKITALSSQEELNIILGRTDFKGSEVMDFLSKKTDLKKLFEASAGVSEGYTIREHTHMVYDTFMEQLPYFKINSVKTPQKIDIERLYRFIISIHDIGKPIAIAKEGKHAQHKYTRPLVEETMSKFNFSKAEISLAISLIDNDILGDVMQGFISPEKALSQLKLLASKNSMSLQDYFSLQSFFYTIDATSYPGLRIIVFLEVEGKLIPKPDSFHALETLVKNSNMK